MARRPGDEPFRGYLQSLGLPRGPLYTLRVLWGDSAHPRRPPGPSLPQPEAARTRSGAVGIRRAQIRGGICWLSPHYGFRSWRDGSDGSLNAFGWRSTNARQILQVSGSNTFDHDILGVCCRNPPSRAGKDEGKFTPSFIFGSLAISAPTSFNG